MPADNASSEEVVLVGAGHAHLYVAARAEQLRRAGARVTLVAPGRTGYSGMASGVLGGRYAAAANLIDPAAVARAGGAAHRDDSVTAVDRSARRLQLASGESLPYDRVSFNLGSVVDAPVAVAGGPRVWPAKPVAGLAALRTALLAEPERAGGDGPAVAVVGGGATGAEIAANLVALAGACGRAPAVTLVEAADRLLASAPPGASAALARRLRRRGVDVRTATRFAGVSAAGLDTDRGPVAADHLVFATGLVAPPLVERLDLPADRVGGIHVDATLRSPVDARVFAVGDCARFLPAPLPRIGVFGVRQAPVLLHNLGASLSGGAIRAYRPQRRWLSILDLGDDTGLLLYGGFWFIGRPALRLKQRLDRGFVAGFGHAAGGGRPA